MQRESIKILGDEANQLVTLSSSLIALYAAALTLFDIPKKASIIGIILITIPIILWLVCIYYSSSINFSKLHYIYLDSPSEIKSFIAKELNENYAKLKLGRYLFIISIASFALILLLANSSVIQDEPNPRTFQFTRSQDHSSESKNTSIPFDVPLIRTIPIKLIKINDKSYALELSNESIVVLDKDKVK
jgi:hypothetical protein